MWKNLRLEYSAGIQTHDLWNTSLLPYALDQGSRPKKIIFFSYILFFFLTSQ